MSGFLKMLAWVVVALVIGAAVIYGIATWTSTQGTESGSGETVAVAPGDVARVPDLVGMSEAEARAALEEAGLVVKTITVLDSGASVPVGDVLAQVPEPETEWIKGQPVGIAVAGGPDTGTGTVVPDVRNDSFDQAVNDLADVGLLAYGITEEPEDLDVPGVQVTEQLPTEGVKVPQGSTVLVLVERE